MANSEYEKRLRKVKQRNGTFSSAVERIMPIFEGIKNELIRKKGKAVKVSLRPVYENSDVLMSRDMKIMNQMLRQDPNIIMVKPTKKTHEVSRYIYVSREKKKKLGFSAVYYHAAEEETDLLARKFAKDSTAVPAKLIPVLKDLNSAGCGEHWHRVSPFGVSARCYMSLDDTVESLKKLNEAGILIVSDDPGKVFAPEPMEFFGRTVKSIRETRAAEADLARMRNEAMQSRKSLTYIVKMAEHDKKALSEVTERFEPMGGMPEAEPEPLEKNNGVTNPVRQTKGANAEIEELKERVYALEKMVRASMEHENQLEYEIIKLRNQVKYAGVPAGDLGGATL